MTTLNSTLTAPALAKALQLTAKSKTMQPGIREPQKFVKQFEAVNSYIILFLLFYNTSLRLHVKYPLSVQKYSILIYLKDWNACNTARIQKVGQFHTSRVDKSGLLHAISPSIL